MTGRELMEWLGGQKAEVLDRKVMVLDDEVGMAYLVMGLIAPDDGVLYVVDMRQADLDPPAGDE